jgi:hypothetical protein
MPVKQQPQTKICSPEKPKDVTIENAQTNLNPEQPSSIKEQVAQYLTTKSLSP